MKLSRIVKLLIIKIVRLIPEGIIRITFSDRKYINILLPDNFFLANQGYCPCCEKEVEFISYHPWLRDNYKCTNCKSIPRERALMIMINKYFPNWEELNIHESSPGTRGASVRLRKYCKNYVATQYFPNKPFGDIIEGVRNEDLESQSFGDESFDLVVTQDVMEHVYEPSKAFKEIARTLKPGGAHIFTVPLVNKFKMTERWAERGTKGEPLFLGKPEYHGNPVDPKGSPVTMHWGYDIVDFIKRESNLESIIEYINDLSYGVRAEYIEVIVSKKD